jgi:hypothetical protein
LLKKKTTLEKALNKLRVQLSTKHTHYAINHQSKTVNTNIAENQANSIVLFSIDKVGLIDWTTINKFARFWDCQDIHCSFICKLAIEKAIQKISTSSFIKQVV